MSNETQPMPVSDSEDIYPLGMAIGTMLLSLFGIFGNSLIIIATLHNKSLQYRCNVLIASLAFTDMVACIYFVQLRIIILTGGFFWTNAKCFLWSIYGLVALNIQSGLGLALGIDRLLAIVQPARYRLWNNAKYLTLMFLPVLVYSVAIAAYGYSQTTTAITPVCLPPAAYSMEAREIWVISNVVIVLLVLLAYGTAQYKIRTANNDATSTEESMKHAKRLLNSLTCVMVAYTATWALTILALGYTETALSSVSQTREIQLWAGWLVIINSSSSVIIYTWRGQEYRKAFVNIVTCGVYYFDNGFKKKNTITTDIDHSHSTKQNSVPIVNPIRRTTIHSPN